MTMRPRWRLLADYGCHALWELGADGHHENLSPDSIEVPAELAVAMHRWAETYTNTLDREDPSASGFQTQRERELFSSWGRALAAWLANALGESVEYFDDASQTYVTMHSSE